MEFSDQESSAFDEIMDIMKKYSGFESIEAGNEKIIALPGLTIYPERRKAYCARKEVLLSAKEFDIVTTGKIFKQLQAVDFSAA